MLSGYAQELQALKTELQHTLARLGGDSGSTGAASTLHAAGASEPLRPPPTTVLATPSARVSAGSAARREPCNRRVSPPSWSVASTQSISTARTTPDAPASAPSAARAHAQSTALDARLLMHELRVASQRRRALEMELAREMQRDQEQRRQRQRDARAPYQQAITALQRQRAEIARQIEADRARDRVERRGAVTGQHVIAAPTAGRERSGSRQQEAQQGQEPETPPSARPKHVLYRDSSTQMSPMAQSPPPLSTHRSRRPAAMGRGSRFAIGGVAALEPVQESGQREHQRPHRIAASAPAPGASDTACAQALAPPELVRRPRETHHDALNDVFSIQLQFAETMRKLEQSVQVREQLLQRSRGKTRVATRGAHRHRRRRDRISQSLLDSDSESRSDGRSTSDDDDGSALSSDASLADYRRRLEQRYRVDDDCERRPSGTRTTAAAAAAVSSQHSPTAQPQPRCSPESATVEERDGAVAVERSPSSSHDPHTPSTESSDKTTGSSGEKTVRFHGALATPVIAKKLFANESDESDLESALSFLNGSSVASAELNDVSLVKAFEAFRRELGMLKGAADVSLSPRKSRASGVREAPAAATPSLSAAVSAARALFPTGDDANDEGESERDDCAHSPRKHPAAVSVAKANGTVANAQPPVVVARVELQALEQAALGVGAMDREALEERRQQLCLDLQAESAQLVLTFGTKNAHETARVKEHLIELRSELRAVDERLGAMDAR